MNVIANDFYIVNLNQEKIFLRLKYLLCSTELLLNMLLKFRVIDGEYIVKVSLNMSTRPYIITI